MFLYLVAMKFSPLHQIIGSEQSSHEAGKNCSEMNGVALGIVELWSKAESSFIQALCNTCTEL